MTLQERLQRLRRDDRGSRTAALDALESDLVGAPEEGLTLKRRRPKRHRSAVARIVRPLPTLPNELWAMDFMHDTLARGESIRVLTVIDVCTRECVALVAAQPALRAVFQVPEPPEGSRGPLTT